MTTKYTNYTKVVRTNFFRLFRFFRGQTSNAHLFEFWFVGGAIISPGAMRVRIEELASDLRANGHRKEPIVSAP